MDDVTYWEGYGKCLPSSIPRGIRFDVNPTTPARRYEVSFGGPADHPGVYQWGAPYRRVVDRKHWTVLFSKYRRVPPPGDRQR